LAKYGPRNAYKDEIERIPGVSKNTAKSRDEVVRAELIR
jgi:hypothetical protein